MAARVPWQLWWYAQLGTPRWWPRMAEAMDVFCDREGQLVCKLHGLRMLDPEVFSRRFPFASADSTNIAQNVGIDSAWRGTYTPASQQGSARAGHTRAHRISAVSDLLAPGCGSHSARLIRKGSLMSAVSNESTTCD